MEQPVFTNRLQLTKCGSVDQLGLFWGAGPNDWPLFGKCSQNSVLEVGDVAESITTRPKYIFWNYGLTTCIGIGWSLWQYSGLVVKLIIWLWILICNGCQFWPKNKSVLLKTLKIKHFNYWVDFYNFNIADARIDYDKSFGLLHFFKRWRF